MSKISIIPNSIEMINKTLKYSDAYIIGIEKLSINMPFYFSLNELYMINDILKENKKELFICLNKNMFNSDIDLLEETLKIIDKLNIKGILYYDISLIELKEKFNLKTDLVWSQEHFTTNYYTINYWYEVIVDDVVKNVDKAIRIMICRNGEKKIYAKANEKTGEAENGTEKFYSYKEAVVEGREGFKPDDVDKFTIVIFIEGDDPDCIDELIGGEMKMHMEITEEHIKQSE